LARGIVPSNFPLRLELLPTRRGDAIETDLRRTVHSTFDPGVVDSDERFGLRLVAVSLGRFPGLLGPTPPTSCTLSETSAIQKSRLVGARIYLYDTPAKDFLDEFPAFLQLLQGATSRCLKPGKNLVLTSLAIIVVSMRLRVLVALLALLSVVCGCRSAYYSTMEKFGVHKRDLLKKSVLAARDEEKAAGQQFTNALTRLKELYGFQGGDLEKTYNDLNREYEKSVDRANAVHKRVKDMETVAGDLFAEWEKELQEISSPELRANDREKLRETRRRYDELHATLKRAEQSMDPVLTRFRDHVLYLKHNLNAAAIASLRGESTNIQAEISSLLQDMNTAIAQADEFINTLP
jgi:hypothetical protein